MQFTQKSKEHIDSCRFCWMCHHVCPIGNATGLERNTARARALGLSLVARDAIEYSDDIINNVYECSLCGGCMTDCVTGWDPVMFTKEARLGAALDGKLPSYVMNMLNNFNEKGNIYGAEKNPNIPVFEDDEILFFLGEDTRSKGCAKEAVELLKKAGVKFAMLDNEPNSGYSLDFLIGAAQETKTVMEECAKVLNNYKKVICYDGFDAKVMMREYKEWGIDLKAEVVTFTSFVASLIEEGKLNVKKGDLVFTPQDSPVLARDLEETEPIRKILSACGTVNEMLLNKEHTQLAGNLIMNEYMPNVIEQVAKDRWKNALNMNAKIVVTESCAEYIMLSKTKPENVELLKLEEAVLKCL
ncbi:MAG: (Fe-S)-binding protein [Ruminococcaceae bacterium]|nr:(Fe-S)-binding protein [Oscillospiraceae bacterium]